MGADDKFDLPDELESRFVRPGELDDLHLLPGEFRAFRREMRDSLDAIARALQTLGRIEARLDAQQDTLNDHEHRLAVLERRPKRKK